MLNKQELDSADVLVGAINVVEKASLRLQMQLNEILHDLLEDRMREANVKKDLPTLIKTRDQLQAIEDKLNLENYTIGIKQGIQSLIEDLELQKMVFNLPMGYIIKFDGKKITSDVSKHFNPKQVKELEEIFLNNSLDDLPNVLRRYVGVKYNITVLQRPTDDLTGLSYVALLG